MKPPFRSGVVVVGTLALAACGSSPTVKAPTSSSSVSPSASSSISVGTPINAEFDYALDASRKIHVKVMMNVRFTTDVIDAPAGKTDVYRTTTGTTTVTNLSKDRAITGDSLPGISVRVLLAKNSGWCKDQIPSCPDAGGHIYGGQANLNDLDDLPPSGVAQVPFNHDGKAETIEGNGLPIAEAMGPSYLQDLSKPGGYFIETNSLEEVKNGILSCQDLTPPPAIPEAYPPKNYSEILWMSDPSLDVCGHKNAVPKTS